MTTVMTAPAAPPASGPVPVRPRLRLLDGFDLRRGDERLALRPASERLLAYLALADKAVERATVAYRLWPDKPEQRAVAILRSAIWRIRQLPPPDLVETTTTHIRLHPAVWVDARDGLDELRRPDPDAVGDGGAASFACGGGELLPDWYDDWLVTERE